MLTLIGTLDALSYPWERTGQRSGPGCRAPQMRQEGRASLAKELAPRATMMSTAFHCPGVRSDAKCANLPWAGEAPERWPERRATVVKSPSPWRYPAARGARPARGLASP
jgi:hypothetical protein